MPHFSEAAISAPAPTDAVPNAAGNGHGTAQHATPGAAVAPEGPVTVPAAPLILLGTDRPGCAGSTSGVRIVAAPTVAAAGRTRGAAPRAPPPTESPGSDRTVAPRSV